MRNATKKVTTTSYSTDGLTTTVTIPAGAAAITTSNIDGSTASVSGTAQRALVYVYDLNGVNEGFTTKLANGTTIAQSITNGFGQTVVQAQPNTLGGFIYTRSEYNAKGQMVKQYQDTGSNTEPTALVSTQKQLISQLSGTLADKSLSINERGLTFTQWSIYNDGTKRENYSSVPTSNITAESISIDGFTISQTDHTGITTTATRNTARNGQTVNDSFAHNSRSELAEATVSGKEYEYTYDNIGNRQFALEDSKATMYDTNGLNQYTAVAENGADAFVPQFDADGNQTLIKTATGIWSAVYNVENRPVTFTNSDSNTVVECQYDSMGRRAYKKVTVNGSVTLHQRYIYREYLQIACIDLTRSHHPVMWLVTWDPTQPVATRPLAIRKDGSWYTYGWDLTKNICEVFGPAGYIRTTYTYSPYGQVTASGDLTQPVQWSSEFYDAEPALVYYNYRHYNPFDGKWVTRDIASREDYVFSNNSPCYMVDITGLASKTVGRISSLDVRVDVETNGAKGQSSMHIHIGDDKYDYRNDRNLPGFYNRETGKPLPNSVQKKLVKHRDWKKIMEKAEQAVNNNGGLSIKFGGGKVIKGCVSVVAALEGANMLNNYVNAMQSGNIKQMEQVFHDFMSNLPDYGTIGRSCIFEDAKKFHEEMVSFVSNTRNKD